MEQAMTPKARVGCVKSAFSRQGYRNRRVVARVFAPTAATGGFPYNLRSVAECDPLSKHFKPQDFGYDA
jgi:hypothetical protein